MRQLPSIMYVIARFSMLWALHNRNPPSNKYILGDFNGIRLFFGPLMDTTPVVLRMGAR
jgi:hypothetical protein